MKQARSIGEPTEGLFASLADVIFPDWIDDALCVEPEYADLNFFAESVGAINKAKAVCERCLVREECLEWAIETGSVDGVWGGMSGKERRRYTREYHREPA